MSPLLARATEDVMSMSMSKETDEIRFKFSLKLGNSLRLDIDPTCGAAAAAPNQDDPADTSGSGCQSSKPEVRVEAAPSKAEAASPKAESGVTAKAEEIPPRRQTPPTKLAPSRFRNGRSFIIRVHCPATIDPLPLLYVC